MTEVFRELQDAINDSERRNSRTLTKEMIENACMYQMASSLIDIDKDLKAIIAEMKKRKV